MGAFTVLIIARTFAERPEIGQTHMRALIIIPVIILHIHYRFNKLHILKGMYFIRIFVKIREVETDLFHDIIDAVLIGNIAPPFSKHIDHNLIRK